MPDPLLFDRWGRPRTTPAPTVPSPPSVPPTEPPQSSFLTPTPSAMPPGRRRSAGRSSWVVRPAPTPKPAEPKVITPAAKPPEEKFPVIAGGTRGTKELQKEEAMLREKERIQTRIALRTEKTARETAKRLREEDESTKLQRTELKRSPFGLSASMYSGRGSPRETAKLLEASPFGVGAGFVHTITDPEALGFAVRHSEEIFKDTAGGTVDYPLFFIKETAGKVRAGDIGGAAAGVVGTAFTLTSLHAAGKFTGAAVQKFRAPKTKPVFTYGQSSAIYETKTGQVVQAQELIDVTRGGEASIRTAFSAKQLEFRHKKVPFSRASRFIDKKGKPIKGGIIEELPSIEKDAGVFIREGEVEFFNVKPKPPLKVVRKHGQVLRLHEMEMKKGKPVLRVEIEREFSTRSQKSQAFRGRIPSLKESLSKGSGIDEIMGVKTIEFVKPYGKKAVVTRGSIIEQGFILDKDIERILTMQGGGRSWKMPLKGDIGGGGSLSVKPPPSLVLYPHSRVSKTAQVFDSDSAFFSLSTPKSMLKQGSGLSDMTRQQLGSSQKQAQTQLQKQMQSQSRKQKRIQRLRMDQALGITQEQASAQSQKQMQSQFQKQAAALKLQNILNTRLQNTFVDAPLAMPKFSGHVFSYPFFDDTDTKKQKKKSKKGKTTPAFVYSKSLMGDILGGEILDTPLFSTGFGVRKAVKRGRQKKK